MNPSSRPGKKQALAADAKFAIAAVPEPETYALMLAGLALAGFMSRRRRV